MNFELISVIVFLLVLAILIYKDRKNIEFKSGLIIKKSTKGKKFIYDFAAKHEKTLKTIGIIGIAISVFASMYGVYLLLNSTYNIFTKKASDSALKVVLPSVEGVKMPGFILGVPFWYWIISVFVVMLAHEPMHALMARAEKVQIKSFGLLLFIILPGAFVEPNEKQLKRKNTISKLRIFAGGSFANLIVAGILFLLILGLSKLLSIFLVPSGVNYESLIEGSYAEKVGLTGVIIRINEQEIKTIEDLSKVMQNIKPGEKIIVETTTSVYEIQTIEDHETGRALIGIKNPYIEYTYASFLAKYGSVSKTTLITLQWIEGLIYWVFVLNLGVGIFNLFPLKPLDGGLMLEAVCEHFFKEKGKKISNLISVLVLVLVLFNIFGPQIIKTIYSII
ncbi:MAG: site-2 protease family protein [Candidatus Aenigmarchaeota archaeon]|nr:site-2 protease family protein [Candidatus Aenigmarchaeota archaeon]MCX8179165.1 site-2 protease family protein [Candidatus Aenigmarchaeota archaeon]